MSEVPKRPEDSEKKKSPIIYSVVGLAVVAIGATVIYFIYNYILAQAGVVVGK